MRPTSSPGSASGSGYGKTPRVEDELKGVKFTANIPLEGNPWFSDLDVGVNYADRSKDKHQPEGNINVGAGTLLAIGCAEAPFSIHTQDNDLQTLKPTLARLQQAPVPKAPMNGSGHAMVYVFAGPERRGPKEAAPPAEVERTLIGYDLTDGKQVFAVPAEVRSRFAVAQGVIAGLGVYGYVAALRYLAAKLQ